MLRVYVCIYTFEKYYMFILLSTTNRTNHDPPPPPSRDALVLPVGVGVYGLPLARTNARTQAWLTVRHPILYRRLSELSEHVGYHAIRSQFIKCNQLPK